MKTLGDHLKKQRLTLKLFQKDVAQKIGGNKSTIYNWETNRTLPGLYTIPKLIEFIGYNPLDISIKGIGEQIKIYRQALRITQKNLARQLKINPCTLAKWEKGKRNRQKNYCRPL